MAKIVTAADACKIGQREREQNKEETFMRIMSCIAGVARHDNHYTFADRVSGSQVSENDLVEFLQANPEQVDRLSNMGYAVEQSIDMVPTKWREDEAYQTPRGLLCWFSNTKYRQVTREGEVKIRSFTITWECEECDDERDETTV